VDQIGKAACYTGHISGFYRIVENGKLRVTGSPVFDPEEVYKK